MKLKKLIQQPYPFVDNDRSAPEILLRSFLVGMFIAAFLLIFQPFGISKWKTVAPDWYLYTMGFGVVTFVCLLIVRFGVIKLFPKFFNEKDWTIGREIFLNIGFLIFIAFGNFLYEVACITKDWKNHQFLWNLLTVIAIGIFPIVFDVLSTYYRALKKYRPLELFESEVAPQTTEIILTAENGTDQLKFNSDELLYIESADNYSKIVLTTKDPVLLRGSLSRMTSQILQDHIKRCHRSFVVNFDKVKKVTGNAQGYKLELKDSLEVIPVARKYSDLVNELKAAKA
ncbi:LytR/AlgR family response regulator transcription factor [Jiulongibacter sp. NS-SX5]|uniref:LytR/AlgR family response regulator transcription factor n=1 Tax=Jiulongibacter sp. NS-SX5 TaxID=3463854 RepID=UPI0040588139